MAIANDTDVTDLGFTKEQFGDTSDLPAYITAIIDDVALEVAELVGATAYAATSGSVEEKRLKHAEKYFTAAELWRRIEVFERRSVRKARSDSGAETISSRALKSADEFEDMAWEQLKAFGVSRETYNGALAVGYIETGALPTVS